MQIIGSKGHTFTPRFTESKSVKMAANMAAKDPPGAKIRILIRLLLVSIHFNDRNLCFIDLFLNIHLRFGYAWKQILLGPDS